MNPLAWLRKILSPGGYDATDPRKAEIRDGWEPDPTPGDEALVPVLADMVAKCRDAERRFPKARAIVDGFRADAVGSGIGIEPDLPAGKSDLATMLRDGFNLWAESAGLYGESLWELQWTAAGEVGCAGASLWRWVAVDDPVGIPLRLVALEVEWLSPDPLRDVPAERFSHGAELDALGRVAFWHLRDPVSGAAEIVPAADIIYASIPRRARQVHGEPVLAPLILRLLQDERLVTTELRASINTASVSGVVTTEDVDLVLGGPAGAVSPAANPGAPPSATMRGNRRLAPGGVLALRPGESWETVENKRPAQGIGTFRSSMDGDLAGGAGVSRQWIDRDSSRANYTSMREDNLRTARVVGPLQRALGRKWASAVYVRLVPYLLMQAGQRWPAAARDRAALCRHDLRPDRIAYVDPLKDGMATTYLVEHNLLTLEEALAQQGRDLRTVLDKRASEQAEIDRRTVDRVRKLHELAQASGVDGLTWVHLVTLAGAGTAPGAYLQAAAQSAPADAALPAPARSFDGFRLVRDERGDLVSIEPALAP